MLDIIKGDKVLIRGTERKGKVLYVREDDAMALIVPTDELTRFWINAYALEIIEPAPRPIPPIVYNRCNLCDSSTSQPTTKLICCSKEIHLCCECRNKNPSKCAVCNRYSVYSKYTWSRFTTYTLPHSSNYGRNRY